MKILVLMILGMISIACRDVNYPEIRDIEQASIVLADPVEIDGELYIPISKSKCFIRMYEHSRNNIGAVSDAQEVDITECDRIIGYEPSTYADYTSWKNSLRRWMLRQK